MKSARRSAVYRVLSAAAAALLQMLSGSQPDEERLEWELFVRASG